jgi:hypothetical protein
MRKLLHLVFAVWKTNRPFNDQHFPWEQPAAAHAAETTTPADPGPRPSTNDKAAGHKRDLPAEEVVATAASTVAPTPVPVNPLAPPIPTTHPKIDFAFVRQQVTMERVLDHLGLLGNLRGRSQQRRGLCPIHSQPADQQRSFSVHLGKNIFQCFHADCGAHGNVLDLWAAVHHVPIYEAALHLAETFHLHLNREEEPV